MKVDADQEGGTRWAHNAGPKVVLPIGYFTRQTSSGNTAVKFVFLVLKDLDAGETSDVGRWAPAEIVMTEAVGWKWGQFIRAMGHRGQHDIEAKGVIAKLLSEAKPFVVDVFLKPGNNGKEYAEVNEFSPYNVKIEQSQLDEWNAQVDGAVAEYQDWRKKQKEKAAAASGAGSSGGQQRRKVSDEAAGSSEPDANAGQDLPDDVPF